MTQYPRRNQHGELIPFLSDYMRGLRMLTAKGLAVPKNLAMVARMGKAIADRDPIPASKDPATLAALDQIQARNVATRAELDQIQARERRRREMELEMDLDLGMDHRPPDISTTITSEVSDPSDGDGPGPGQGGSVTEPVPGTSVRIDPFVPDEEQR